jgi:hypothetical protein
MRESCPKVHVIVAPDFGEKLASLPANEPSWVADTPSNKPVVERMWAQKLAGITSFRIDEKARTGDWLISILDEVELHHGEYSQSQPYSELYVYGVSLSGELRKELECYGFNEFQATDYGFVAHKMAA